MRYGFVSLLCLLLCMPVPLNAQDSSSPNPAPQLVRISSDTCLLGGQRVHINGTQLGNERLYQLELHAGQQPLVLRVEKWGDTAISALLPMDLKVAEPRGVLVLRARRTGALTGNRLAVRLCTAQEIEQTPSVARIVTHERTAEPPEPVTRRSNAGAAGVIVPAEQTAPPAADTDEADAEEHELIVFSEDMAAARQLDAQLQPLGYSIKRRRDLKQLGMVLSVIRLPEGVALRDARQQLQQRDRRLLLDANHRYRPGTAQVHSAQQQVQWGKVTSSCGKGLRLGLVDTLVDTRHPSLATAQVVSRSFLPLGVPAADQRHATAIASILVGAPQQGKRISGLLPAARLYNAGIFRQRGSEAVDTTAELIITALDWLQGQHVQVINLSLAGRSNRLLQRAIGHVFAQGPLLVAAAGNAGPGAPPAYPAAWPEVVAVTAVDSQDKVYREANRGDYIDLAAPGVDVWVARPGAEGAYHSGTSYAVPYVSAALAVLRQRHPALANSRLHTELQKQARDLGAPGKDPVYGYGLLQLRDGCN